MLLSETPIRAQPTKAKWRDAVSKSLVFFIAPASQFVHRGKTHAVRMNSLENCADLAFCWLVQA
jgi:hypothetical protein